MFSICELNAEEGLVLNSIVKFILDVYVPSFLSIYMQPSAVQGPRVVLKIRDFLKGCGEVALPVKECFLNHAATWLNPKVAALALLDDDAPELNPQRLSVREPDLPCLLWSNRPITAFLNALSAASPCFTQGYVDD